MCQIYKMLYNYPMSIWKALHAHWRTTSSPKHAKHIIWRIIQVRMSFIPHMIFSVTQMIMLLLCLLLFVWRGFHFEYLLLALWWICRYWFKWIQFTCALGWIWWKKSKKKLWLFRCNILSECCTSSALIVCMLLLQCNISVTSQCMSKRHLGNGKTYLTGQGRAS